MKLYATTTSERASKGQGGNKKLLIEVKDDNKETIAMFNFVPFVDSIGDGIKLNYWVDERIYQEEIRKELSKSKQKKDEHIHTLDPKTRECTVCHAHDTEI